MTTAQSATVLSCWRVQESGKYRASVLVYRDRRRMLVRLPVPLEPGAEVRVAPRRDSVEWFLVPEMVAAREARDRSHF